MSTLTPVQIREDLSQFQRLLETRFAYLYNGQPNYRATIETLRESADLYRTPGAFGFELQKILAMFIDGHAQVSQIALAKGFLPCLLEPVGERVVAILPDRQNFLDETHPYLAKLDGLELSDWLALCACAVPQGSPQYRRLRSLRLLSNLQHWRAVAGLPQTASVTLTLVSEDGRRAVTRELLLTETMLRYGERHRRAAQMLPGDVAYLRLGRMNDQLTADIQHFLAFLKGARGVVIDVRGNSGGTRQALLQFAPRLMQEGDVPYVASVAAYRLHPDVSENHLASRSMYREDSSRWSESERRAIRTFSDAFRPEVEPRTGSFSDWHYLVLSRDETGEHLANRPPVVLLMNAHCFSATDIFLAAFKGRPGVTLVGEASSGGSGYALTHELNNSGLKLRLSSMLSYQPSGELYDTNGVQPDIALEPILTDFLGSGTDTMLTWVLDNCFSA